MTAHTRNFVDKWPVPVLSVWLDDKYMKGKDWADMTGTQVLVGLLREQKARDESLGFEDERVRGGSSGLPDRRGRSGVVES